VAGITLPFFTLLDLGFFGLASQLLTEVCRLIEGAKAEVYTAVIILAIVLVHIVSHSTMANTV
jgi:hypothetical protein